MGSCQLPGIWARPRRGRVPFGVVCASKLLIFLILLVFVSLARANPNAQSDIQEDQSGELPAIEATLEGNILVRSAAYGNGSFPQALLADPDRLWPSGIVEYKFYRTFPRRQRTLVKKAMNYISNRTSCVTF